MPGFVYGLSIEGGTSTAPVDVFNASFVGTLLFAALD